MKIFISLIFYCLLMSIAIGQNLSGKVISTDGKPLAAVSIAVLQDSNFLAGTVSGEMGQFKVSAAFVLHQTYRLQLSLIGHQTIKKIFIYADTTFTSSFVLEPTASSLSDVTVVAKTPLVTRKADRYIVHVENSYLANGNTGLDVLQKSPGLWVGSNGSIRIKGNQSVTVMINDVVQRMSDAELADYLRSLRSEDISKIEIIPNPPSEYEASSTGGIVHIILKKSRQDGLTGTLYGQYRQQGKSPYASAGTLMDFKLQRFYLQASYVYTIDRSFYTGFSHTLYPNGSKLNNIGNRTNNNTRQQYRVAAAYDIAANQTINLQTIGTGNTLDQHFYSSIDYAQPGKFTTGTANTNWLRKPETASTTLNYTWRIDTLGSTLKMIADNTTNNKTESNQLVSVYSDTARNATSRTNTPSHTHLYSIQTDFTKALKNKTALKAGAKYVGTSRDNTLLTERYINANWLKDAAASNRFQYQENLYMAYISFEKVIQKTSIKAGLRAEQTHSKGLSLTTNQSIDRSYFGLFPSLFVDHALDEKAGTSVHFNYARRVKRPGYNDLNPYRLQVSDFNILTGNPDLVPQYTHSLQAGLTLRQKYNADVYFLSTHNFIAQTASTLDSNVVEYKSKNYPSNTEFGFSLNATVVIGKIWNMNNGLQVYHSSSNLITSQLTRTSFSLKSIHTLTFKKVGDIDVYADYTSAYLTANTRQSEIFYSEIGFSRKMWKNSTRLRLVVQDIFNTAREKELTQYDNTRIDFYQKRPTRTISLSISYNFKAGKTFTKKKIEQQGSDEKNRL